MEVLLRTENTQTVFSNSRGLTFSDGKTPGHILASDCTGLFDVALSDTVYAAYVSDTGEIILMEKLGREWKRSVILKSRSGMMNIFGIRLMISGENLNLIYGLRHNSENLIVHQSLPRGTPQVVTASCSERFFVRRDDCGCIYIITEAAENIWHFSFMRNGSWSSPEELITDCVIEDIMTDGYKNFCLLVRNESGCFVRYADTEFGVNGKNLHLIKHNGFKVISENRGRIYCTDISGESLQITSETVKNYILRLPGNGEYAVCEHCSGNLIHGIPRLFLIDRVKPPASADDSVRLELTKRILELEARIAQLETKMCNPAKEPKALPENL